MKALDFDLSKDLTFNMQEGMTTFKDSRLLIMDANAMGLLQQQLLDEVGWERARHMLLKFGFQNGYSDFMQMKLAYQFDSENGAVGFGSRNPHLGRNCACGSQGNTF